MNQLLIAVCLIVSFYLSSGFVGTLSLLCSSSSKPVTYLSSKHPSGAGRLLLSPVYRWETVILRGRVICPRSHKKSVAKQGIVHQSGNPRGINLPPARTSFLSPSSFKSAELQRFIPVEILWNSLRMQSLLFLNGWSINCMIPFHNSKMLTSQSQTLKILNIQNFLKTSAFFKPSSTSSLWVHFL